MQQPTTGPAGYVSAPYTFVDGTLAVVPPQRPATLAEMARQGTHYQVRPTRRGLGGPTTDPQHQALAIAAEQGRVLRGGKPGQGSVRVLTALARRGLLTLTPFPGSRKSNWAYGVLTGAGRRELARLDAEQAEREAFEARRDQSSSGLLKSATRPVAAADPFELCRDRHSAEADLVDAALGRRTSGRTA